MESTKLHSLTPQNKPLKSKLPGKSSFTSPFLEDEFEMLQDYPIQEQMLKKPLRRKKSNFLSKIFQKRRKQTSD
jgi:hypothetical protein